MFTAIVIFHVLASIFLILVILLQAGRGSGLAEGFGGGAMMQNIFGSSSSTILTKATAVCAIVFILTSLTLTILTSRRNKSLIDLEKGKVSNIIASQRHAPSEVKGSKDASRKGVNVIPTQQPQPQAAGQPVGASATQPQEAINAKTVTVREVKIDPATGKEIVVKEEKMTPQEAAERQKQQTPAPPVETQAAQPEQGK